MEVIKPSVVVMWNDVERMLQKIECAYRICYQSKADEKNRDAFIRACMKRGHYSPLEHESITVVVTCDRGVTHEIVRHRIASYSQESTRYCNYVFSQKNPMGIKFIEPIFWDKYSEDKRVRELYLLWENHMDESEFVYNKMLELGAKPQEARTVLPNSLKTQIMITMNLREWRHFFNLRSLGTTGTPHPQMKQVADALLESFNEHLQVIFGDLEVEV